MSTPDAIAARRARVYRHRQLGLSQRDIARAEGVSVGTVNGDLAAIGRGDVSPAGLLGLDGASELPMLPDDFAISEITWSEVPVRLATALLTDFERADRLSGESDHLTVLRKASDIKVRISQEIRGWCNTAVIAAAIQADVNPGPAVESQGEPVPFDEYTPAEWAEILADPVDPAASPCPYWTVSQMAQIAIAGGAALPLPAGSGPTAGAEQGRDTGPVTGIIDDL